jgi:hypothetical protein
MHFAMFQIIRFFWMNGTVTDPSGSDRTDALFLGVKAKHCRMC